MPKSTSSNPIYLELQKKYYDSLKLLHAEFSADLTALEEELDKGTARQEKIARKKVDEAELERIKKQLYGK